MLIGKGMGGNGEKSREAIGPIYLGMVAAATNSSEVTIFERYGDLME
jgi:hypothetical protein